MILKLLTQHATGTYQITKFFNLTIVWNAGISFGLLQEFKLHPIIFATISLIALVLISIAIKNGYYCVKGIIIGGALGNIVDRFEFGKVLDFIDLHLGTWHYPAFNIADIAIVSGILSILFLELFYNSDIRKTVK